MRIDSCTAPLRTADARPAAARPDAAHSRPRNADTVTISEEARQASIAAQLEQTAGLSQTAAEKLASGDVTIQVPDWDAFEIPVLRMNPEPMLRQKTYGETLDREFADLAAQVEAYYAPLAEKTEGMTTNEALLYLYETYRLPWMGDRFAEGAQLPPPPEGMSREASEMACDQLTSMLLGRGPAVVRDPFALGPEGVARFDNADALARNAAQAAWDAAQRELDARGQAEAARHKEQFRQQLEAVNATGSGVCLGFMALGKDEM